MTRPNYAYLSEGKLWIHAGESGPQAVESQFAKQVKERASSIARGLEWKSSGPNAMFSYGACSSCFDPTAYQVLPINALSRGRAPGELMYSLRTPDVGGVFVNSFKGNDELRLVHSNKLLLNFLNCSTEHKRIVCSIENGDGSMSLSVLESDGTRPQAVTSGDSLDLAPSWVPGQESQVVFQSAGIGRDTNGRVGGLAPFAIQKLDFKTGTLEVLAEDSKFDFVSPRLLADGTLLAIRRPYLVPGKQPLGKLVLDFLLVPFRLLKAVFSWLNFFSMRYSGQPLHSAGSVPRQGPDLKKLVLWGNVVQAEKMSERQATSTDVPSLVPKTWELVRRKPGAEIEVLAQGVVSFDARADGSLIYSNGRALYSLAEGAKPQILFKGQGCIEQVVFLD